MDKIHISDITEISRDRIYYREETGNVVSIELGPCADSYEASHKISNRSSAVRCIGERFFGEYAYYEIYTAEHIQFHMSLKTNPLKKFISRVCGWNFHAQDFQKFYSLQKQLNELGWTTLDLS